MKRKKKEVKEVNEVNEVEQLTQAEEPQAPEKPKAAPKVSSDRRIKWRNRGGTFRMGSGKIIKPNQTFMATPEEVPMAFRDFLKPEEPLPTADDDSSPAAPIADAGYRLKKLAGDQYNILDGRGKVVNEKPLSKSEAQDVLDQLAGD